MRIAIVGFGPRGLGALERLIAHRGTRSSDAIEVTIFEPHAVPGCGPAYDPGLPPFLLMNFPASKIDLNWNAEGPPSAFAGGSFAEWAELDPGQARSYYPSRAQVGRYLSTVASELIDCAPFPIELVTEPVVAMSPGSPTWTVHTDSRSREYDEVLLAVGHAPRRASSDRSPDSVGASSPVGIRGFGLTAIDLILNLTEGRGGQFEPAGPASLRYLGTGAEPSLMVPHTRGGRPMLVKPELAQSPASRERLMTAIPQRRVQVLELPSGSGIDHLGEVIASLCANLLLREDVVAAAASWIASAREAGLRPVPDPAAAIDESLRIASGQAAPGLDWALGLAWRSLYPAIVERYSHGGLPESEYEPFGLLAAEMERLAFGPPPVNAAKLLALVEAGILDVSRLGEVEDGQTEIELDAVTEPPGLLLHQPPLAHLVAAGAVRVPQGARGIEVRHDARCVGADGEPTEGLAACGRLTEDWVIGNDTLNRNLHPEIDRWAETVCAATRTAPAVAVES